MINTLQLSEIEPRRRNTNTLRVRNRVDPCPMCFLQIDTIPSCDLGNPHDMPSAVQDLVSNCSRSYTRSAHALTVYRRIHSNISSHTHRCTTTRHCHALLLLAFCSATTNGRCVRISARVRTMYPVCGGIDCSLTVRTHCAVPTAVIETDFGYVTKSRITRLV